MLKLFKLLALAAFMVFITGCDNIKPVITLLGDNEVTVIEGESYVDAGATAKDITVDQNNKQIEVDITKDIVTNNSVDTTKVGEYKLTYNVTDAEGNKADEVIRTVTVKENTGGGEENLIVHTLPGTVVAIHDTTTLAPLQSKIADENGTATFEIKDREKVTFSVSNGPETEITEQGMFQVIKEDFTQRLNTICFYHDDPVPLACRLYNTDLFLLRSRIGNELLDLVLNEELNASDMDINTDGYINSTEYYTYMLNNKDKNKDGKLVWSEYSKDKGYIESSFTINVPVGEYKADKPKVISGGYLDDLNYAPTTMNFNGFTNGESIEGINGNHYWINKDGNTIAKELLMEPHLDVNRKFSYGLKYGNEESSKYLLALDKTKNELKNVSYRPEDFNLIGENISLKVPEVSEDQRTYLFVNPTYKKYMHDIPGVSTNSDVHNLIKDPRLNYFVTFIETDYDDVNDRSINLLNFKRNEVFKSIYDASDYPNLDIDLLYSKEDTVVSFSGQDINKIDAATMYFSGTNNDGTSIRVNFYYASVPESLSVPEMKDILPLEIVNSLPEHFDDARAICNLHEFNKSGWVGNSRLLDVISSEFRSTMLLYEVGGRLSKFTIKSNTILTPTVTSNIHFKPLEIMLDPWSTMTRKF